MGSRTTNSLPCPPCPGAEPLDRAFVKLHEAPHQREADPEAALSAVGPLIRLHEQLEDARERLGGHAFPIVADADHRLIRLG